MAVIAKQVRLVVTVICTGKLLNQIMSLLQLQQLYASNALKILKKKTLLES